MYELCIARPTDDISPSFRSIIVALSLTICPIWLLKMLIEHFTNLVLSIKNRGRRKSGKCIGPFLKLFRVHINFHSCHCLLYRVWIAQVIKPQPRKQTAVHNSEGFPSRYGPYQFQIRPRAEVWISREQPALGLGRQRQGAERPGGREAGTECGSAYVAAGGRSIYGFKQSAAVRAAADSEDWSLRPAGPAHLLSRVTCLLSRACWAVSAEPCLSPVRRGTQDKHGWLGRTQWRQQWAGSGRPSTLSSKLQSGDQRPHPEEVD